MIHRPKSCGCGRPDSRAFCEAKTAAEDLSNLGIEPVRATFENFAAEFER